MANHEPQSGEQKKRGFLEFYKRLNVVTGLGAAAIYGFTGNVIAGAAAVLDGVQILVVKAFQNMKKNHQERKARRQAAAARPAGQLALRT